MFGFRPVAPVFGRMRFGTVPVVELAAFGDEVEVPVVAPMMPRAMMSYRLIG
ncbi:MAG: hypothetical protein ACXW3E_05545 [Thermoanaerobaculia bacterium]